MFPEILAQPEGKTLEFKESLKSPHNIIKTIIAFANTAGGTIVIGVEDQTKKIIGIPHVLEEEERITNIIADAIEPLLLPEIDIVSHGNHELLIIHVPYLAGLHYHKQTGINKGTYVRLGSTNRLADAPTISALLRTAQHLGFDETPCLEATIADLDSLFITQILGPVYKNVEKNHYLSLGLTLEKNKKTHPTYGALLLFSPDRFPFLPDTFINCICYAGETREKIIDRKEIKNNMILAIDDIIAFIERHTNLSAQIGKIKREDVQQFPTIAVREAVINAIVHADYSLLGTSIQIAIYADKIEITNPGALPFGQSLGSALSGVSKIRNRVMARIFRELKLIERLGSGIPRILAAYAGRKKSTPLFEEINNHFRVTLYALSETRAEPRSQQGVVTSNWEALFLEELTKHPRLSTREIAEFWQVTERTARLRLRKLLDKKLIQRTGNSKTDPRSCYILGT